MKDPAGHRVGQLVHDGFWVGGIREPTGESAHLFIYGKLGTVDDGSDHHPDSIRCVEAGPCRGRLFGDELLQVGSGPVWSEEAMSSIPMWSTAGSLR